MKKLVILTGAGMSTGSDISTFRNPDRLREKYRVKGVATPEGFATNPKLVLDFYNRRRRELLNTKPNAGYLGLAASEKDFDVRIITQNIDNLHERAGSSHVIHLRGELMKACSVRDMDTTYDLSPENSNIHLGDKDLHGDQLRPFVVWFGEAVPAIEPSIKLMEDCDIFVIIDTSLNVYPATGLLNYVRRGQPIYLIDPKDVRAYRNDIEHIQAGASEGVKGLIELLTQNQTTHTLIRSNEGKYKHKVLGMRTHCQGPVFLSAFILTEVLTDEL